MTHADLRGLSDKGWNEIVVDGRGNAYINGGIGIALLTRDGSVRHMANSFAFPNGMAVTSDNLTSIIAESHGKRLTAFDIHCSSRPTGAGSIGFRQQIPLRASNKTLLLRS